MAAVEAICDAALQGGWTGVRAQCSNSPGLLGQGCPIHFSVRHYLCHLNTVTLDIGSDFLRKLQLLILFWDADF